MAERQVIAHCDIDAFFASVELLRHPELVGRPVVVAGSGPRAVVTTASYEARRFGIDSAMPAARARVLCPEAVFIPPDHGAYREKSSEVWGVVRERIPVVQQVGIDEAYLDVTEFEQPMRALRELVSEVEARTRMVMSVGVGPSKLVAKTVSASFKPRAFRALSREHACAAFAARPARILQGVGPKTAERLERLGVRTVGELQQLDEDRLRSEFGKNLGSFLKARAWFEDESRVAPVRGPAKSHSNERTFPEDIADHGELEEVLAKLARELCEQVQRKELLARNIAIKVRLNDWTTVTRARTVAGRTNEAEVVIPVVLELFRNYAPARPVRLLGVRLAGFDEPPRARAVPARGQLALPLAPSTSDQ